MPVMPALGDARAVLFQARGKRVEQLGRREHALDVVPGRQHGHGLVDDVLLIRLQMLHPALLDELDDPARVEIDAKADAAAMLAKMLDRQAEPAGAGGPEHQPVRPLREVFVGQGVAEQLVVDPVVLDDDAGSWECRWCRPFRRRRSACCAAPWAPSGARDRRGSIRPRTVRTSSGRRRS